MIQDQLRQLGYQLEAESFQIRWFALGVDLEKVRLSGPGLALTSDAVSVNAASSVLWGKIHLEEGKIQNLDLELDPDGFPASESGGDSGPLPQVQIDHFSLDGKVGVKGQNPQPLLLAVDQLKAQIEGKSIQLQGTLLLPERDPIPPQILFRIQTQMMSLVDFQAIQARFEAGPNHLDLNGSYSLASGPDLSLQAQAPDLYQSKIDLRLVGQQLTGSIQGELPVQDQTFPLFALLYFDLSKPEGVLNAELGSARVEVNVSRDDEWLAQVFVHHLDPKMVLADFPLGLQTYQAGADLHFSEPALQHLQGTFWAQGLNQMPFFLRGTLAGSDWQANLQVQDPNLPLRLDASGDLDRFSGLVSVHGAQASALRTLGLPGEVGFSTADLVGEFAVQDQALQIPQAQFQVRELAAVGQPLGELNLKFSGSPDRIHWEMGLIGPAQARGLGWIKPQSQVLGDVCLDFQVPNFQFEELAIHARGNGQLAGPLDHLTGSVFVDYELTHPSVSDLVEGSIVLQPGDQGWPNTTQWRIWDGQVGALSYEGNGLIDKDKPIEVQMEVHHPETAVPLIVQGTRIPFFDLHLTANQEWAAVDMNFPQQTLMIGDLAIPLVSKRPLQMEFQMDMHQEIETPFQLEVAGMQISDVALRRRDETSRFRFRFALVNPTELWSVLPADLQGHLELYDLQGNVWVQQDRFGWTGGVDQVELSGNYDGLPFVLGDLNATYDEDLHLGPFKGTVAGLDIFCNPLPPQAPLVEAMALLEPVAGFETFCTCQFSLAEPYALAHYLDPSDSGATNVRDLSGQFFVGFDMENQVLRAAVGVTKMDMDYQGIHLQGQDLGFAYDGELKLLPGVLQIDQHQLSLTKSDTAISLKGSLGTPQIAAFVPGITGSGILELDARYDTVAGTTEIRLHQDKGPIIIPDPYLSLEQFNGLVQIDAEGAWKIQYAQGLLNRGPFQMNGGVKRQDGVEETVLQFFGSGISFFYDDLQARLTASLQWTMGAEKSRLAGAVVLADGFYSPQVELVGFVQDMLAESKGIYFPDRDLAKTELLVNIQTENPLIVEHPSAFLEVSSPSVLLTGNLAEPSLNSGAVFINEGSEIRLGKDTLVFQSSQVYFHPNRPDDPYLQIFLEYGEEFSQKKTLQMLGYTSDLESQFNSGDLTGFIANYLLGKVSSKVSVESEGNTTSFNQSFAVVLTQPLGRKLVTRYALPLDGKPDRFELGIGPFSGNLLSVIWTDNQPAYDLRHRDRFGNPTQELEKIKKIQYVADKQALKHLKKFPLHKGDFYSETQLRYGRSLVERKLMKLGYLHPTFQSEFKDGLLTLGLELNQQTQLESHPSGLEKNDQLRALQTLKYADYGAESRLESLFRQKWVKEGYTQAQVQVQVDENHYVIHVEPGPKRSEVKLNFGEANLLLSDIRNSKSLSLKLVLEYLVSPASVESEIRAELAGKGYAFAKLEPGRFVQANTFEIPVSLGKITPFLGVDWEADALVTDPTWLGEPFTRERLDEITRRLQSQLAKNQRLSISPLLEDDGVRIRARIFTIEEPTFQSVEFAGNERIKTRRLDKFVQFKPGDSLSKLSNEQEQLIQTGAFRTVRLLNAGESAKIELEEQNRWDLDYGLNLNEKEQLGVVTQFRDKMFLGLNELSARGEWNEDNWQVSGQLRMPRIFGSPLTFYTLAQWDRTFIDEKPLDIIGAFSSERHYVFPENKKVLFELSYPFKRHHEIKLGYEFRVNINHEDVIYHDDFDAGPGKPIDESRILSRDSFTTTTDLAPIKLSYVYRNFDHKTNPRNGILGSFSYEQYLKLLGSENNINGPRFSLNYTQFWSHGPWMWTQRYKAGVFFPQLHLEPASENDPLLFYLGGPSTLRGYDANSIGPTRLTGDPFTGFQVEFLGGEAMVFGSQELSYYLPWFDLGLSTFLDAGNVWSTYDDVDLNNLGLSTGLGLNWDGPIGYLRLDWIYRLDDPIDPFLISDPTLDPRRNFHIRFGRVF